MDITSDSFSNVSSPVSTESSAISPTTSNPCNTKWSKTDDERLNFAVTKFGEKRWKVVSDFVATKSNMQCRQRWLKCTRPGIRKGKWTESEDTALTALMKDFIGCTYVRWKDISDKMQGRTPKQCRERWQHYLNPEVKKTPFTLEEDTRLACLYRRLGNQWALIAQHIPGRTENQVRFRVDHLRLKKSNLIQTKAKIYQSSNSSKNRLTTYPRNIPNKNEASLDVTDDTLSRQSKPIMVTEDEFYKMMLQSISHQHHDNLAILENYSPHFDNELINKNVSNLNTSSMLASYVPSNNLIMNEDIFQIGDSDSMSFPSDDDYLSLLDECEDDSNIMAEITFDCNQISRKQIEIVSWSILNNV